MDRIIDENFDDFQRLQAKVKGFVPTLPKDDVDSNYEDLLLRVTPETTEFIDSFIKHKGLGQLCIMFRSDIDGDLWYRIKFGNMWHTVKPTGYAVQRRTDFSKVSDSVEEFMTLYHNTTLDGLDGILYDMEISNDKFHSEGHGRMVWFSDRLGDYDKECTISIRVPVEEIDNGKFKKMNESHYVSYDSVDLTNYDFDVVKIAGHTIELIEEMVVNITNIVKSEGVEDYMVENEVYDRLIRYIGIYNNDDNSYPSIIEYIEKVIFGWM